MKKILIGFLCCIALITIVTGNEIILEKTNDGNFISFQSENYTKLAGWIVQLNFTPDTQIHNITPLPPYIGSVNIKNQAGYAKIVGFTSTAKEPQSNRLAKIDYEGEGKFSIIVFELVDTNRNPVTVNNIQVKPTPPVTEEPLPVFTPYSLYKSPVSVGSPSPELQKELDTQVNPVQQIQVPESSVTVITTTISKTQISNSVSNDLAKVTLSNNTSLNNMTNVPTVKLTSTTTKKTNLSIVTIIIALIALNYLGFRMTRYKTKG